MDEVLHTVGLLIAGCLWTLLLVQAIGATQFMRTLWNGSRHAVEGERPADALPRHTPQAVVVLCLRGSDPFLGDCVRGVLCQEYADYRLLVVVDHPQDPAADTLQQILEAAPDTLTQRVQVLYRELDGSADEAATCSLKCSSLLQAIESVPEDVELFVQLDADTIPHPTWLAELAEPFRDPSVGAASGNRWYAPRSHSCAALMRRVWNMGAIMMMYFAHIPWGGTLGIRMDLLRDPELLGRWRRSFCEDTLLYAYLKQRGMRVAFVPSLIMTNREDCRLRDFYPWMRRQLLTVRLYHPCWTALLVHGVGSALLWLSTLSLFVWGCATRDWLLVQIIGATLVAYTGGMIVAQDVLQCFVSRIARHHLQQPPTIPWTSRLMIPALTIVTPLTYAAALLGACFMRKTSWRGIDYDIHGPWKIARGDYQPYREHPSAQQPHSL